MAETKNTTPAIDSAARDRIIRKTSMIGIFGNLFLAVLKISIGFVSGSFALVGDGIDSLTDVLTSGIILFTGSIASKPPDIEYPYGHRRAETIATKTLSFIIFFAGAQLGLTAIRQLITQAPRDVPSSAAFIAIGISIAGKIFLSRNKYKAGKKADSSMLIADAENMRNDILLSLNVLVGVSFTIVLKMPILDTITTLLVSAWILRSAYKIFTETSVELMDGLDSPEIYRKVFTVVKKVKGLSNPHKTRIRKLNNVYIVDMDIEVDGNLSVIEGHKIAIAAEEEIRSKIDHIYDVNIHIEPIGNIEKFENFGVTEDLLKKE